MIQKYATCTDNAMPSFLSILIPVYNAEKYLRNCLDSILAQSITDWQCYCMNDGSKDNTLIILEEYAQKDSRFHIYSQQNQGPSKALNALLDEMDESAYLSFIDSDDFIHPKTFEMSINCMEKQDADLVEYSLQKVANCSSLADISAEEVTQEYLLIEDFSIYLSRKKALGGWINKCNKLYRYASIKDLRFDDQLCYEEDFMYESIVHSRIAKKVILHAQLYYYRTNPNSLTKSIRFERYVKSAIRRIELSDAYFIKQNRVSSDMMNDFMSDLSKDAYRMILQKNMKKNKNLQEKKQLFLLASDSLRKLTQEQIIDPSKLSFFQRLALRACIAKQFWRCYILVMISAI